MADTTLYALKGIIARLKAYAALTAITSTRIYTNTPQQTIFPYVVVEISSSRYSTKDSIGMLHELTIHGFSRDDSLNEVDSIAQKVFTALNENETSVTLDSGSLIRLEYNGLRDTFKEADGMTWHSVITFDLLIS